MNAKTHYEAGLSHYILNAHQKNVMMATHHFKSAAEQDYGDAYYFLGRLLTLGDHMTIDYKQAMVYYQQGAKLNSAKCNYAIGLMYQSGLGVIKNVDIATSYFEQAYLKLIAESKAQDPVSMYILGTYYYYGYTVKPSIFQSMDYLLAAANLGLSDALYMLGMIYESESEDEKQRLLAKSYYEKAVAMHHPYALYALAMMAIEEENLTYAITLLEKAANQQYALAAFSIGMIYYEKFPKQKHKGFEWFYQAAKSNHREAQYYTGLCYQQGIGVEKDIELAIYWYQQAALKNEKNALYHLAMLLMKQKDRNMENIFQLLLQAAREDHPLAQYNLGVMYQKGDGTNMDMHQSIYWYEQASLKDIPMALYNLGMLYFEGKHIDKDEQKAKSLWEKAAKLGYEPAVKLMFSINNYEKLQKSGWQS